MYKNVSSMSKNLQDMYCSFAISVLVLTMDDVASKTCFVIKWEVLTSITLCGL